MGYRSGADANMEEAMELNMTAGLEMEMVGVMGKLKETVWVRKVEWIRKWGQIWS